jgi:hypothetical protein
MGILVRSAEPIIRACRLSGIGQTAILVTDQAQPLILNSRIESTPGTGLNFTRQAKGEVKNCLIQGCGVGLQVVETAAPLLLANQLTANQTGLRVGGTANPVLRQNYLCQNQQTGLLVVDQANPDLGQPTDPAGNILRSNGQVDLRNDSSTELLAVGNDLLPQTILGAVTLAPSHQPDPAAIPAILMDPAVVNPVTPGIATEATAVAPPVIPPTLPTSISRFPDLAGHWAAAYVQALADRNLVKGFSDGTYRPNDTINRAQFAALVASSYGTAPLVRTKVEFIDVPAGFWAYGAIDRAQQQGFVGGYPDHTYRPQQPITRVQAIAAVATGLQLPGAGASVLGLYSDRAQIPSYGINALAAATQAGLVVNHPDPSQLRPQEPITRAEVAALIYQGLVARGQAPRLAITTIPLNSMVQGSFPDIQGHWAQDFIQGLLNANLVQGHSDGCFYPDQAVNRSQFAALISQAFRPPVRRPPYVSGMYPAVTGPMVPFRAPIKANFCLGSPINPLVPIVLWCGYKFG